MKPFVNDPLAWNLIDRLLTLDPSKRVNALDALDDDFFWSDPMPCSLEITMSSFKKSMFQHYVTQQHYQQQQQQHQARQAHVPQPKATFRRSESSVDSGYADYIF